MKSYVSTKRESIIEYLSRIKNLQEIPILQQDKVVGEKSYCLDKNILIEIEHYPYLNNLYIVRTNDQTYLPPKGLIEVSDLYSKENILDGIIKVPNYILEGTDGIGKSTTIELLIKEGIVCFDRNLETICRYMLFDVPLETRISEYKKYLERTKDKIIFLINMDSNEILRRIYSRKQISEFDKHAVEYNQMYLDTYKELERREYLFDKLFLADCTGLSIEDQKNKIKQMVLR